LAINSIDFGKTRSGSKDNINKRENYAEIVVEASCEIYCVTA